METVDFSAGVLVPFYDHDTRMVYLAGKVEISALVHQEIGKNESFRVTEIFVTMKLRIKVNPIYIISLNINRHHHNVVLVKESSFFIIKIYSFLLGIMPKIGLDVTRNEVMRFYKLFATGSVCEPISMIGKINMSLIYFLLFSFDSLFSST